MHINQLKAARKFWKKGMISTDTAVGHLFDHLIMQQKINITLLTTLNDLQTGLDKVAQYMAWMVTLEIDDEEE